ncbi:MAG: hypothetical protein JWQ16_1983, partial [Novosphingobium sp.]|nr:hypothetical protein [Novosphingobium sp.]
MTVEVKPGPGHADHGGGTRTTRLPILAGRAAHLDSLRAIAVIAVILGHTLPSWFVGKWDVLEIASFAVYGFFVLSGYLITLLLLEAKVKWRQMASPMVVPIGRFYGRRALRLYPVFYLTLAGALIIGVPGIREEAPFHLFQVSNWIFYANVEKFSWAGHFWSLAIEAQFYVVLPWLVFLLGKRGLASAYVVLLALGTMSWITTDWALAALIPEGFLNTSTLQSLDSLAIGGLLAMADFSQVRWLGRLPRLIVPLAGLTLVTGLPMVFDWGDLSIVGEAVNHTVMNLFFACLVFQASRGFSGRAGAILSWKPLPYLGLISYTVYVLHVFIVWSL